MSTIPVTPPFETYTGVDGQPLDGGYIYFGLPNLNPELNPVSVFWDAAATIPAAQPIRTQNGYPSYDGAPGKIYVAQNFSMTVKDSNGVQQFYIGSTAPEFDLESMLSGDAGAALVGYKLDETGAVATTVQERLAQSVDIRDFGAACDGVTNDAAALEKAIDTGRPVRIEANTKLNLSAAQSAKFIEASMRVFPLVLTTFNLAAGVIDISGSVDLYNPFAINMNIVGADGGVTSLTGATHLAGTAGSHSIQISVSDTSPFEVGEYVIVSFVSGAENSRLIEGCHKITAKAAGSITVVSRANITTWPTMSVTAGTLYPMKTVLKWPLGCAGLRVAGCGLRGLSNVVLSGSFDVTANPSADSPNDGLQIGTAPDTSKTGLNGSEEQNSGSVWSSRIGLVEWAGNGLQVSGGNFFGVAASACANGWRGFQAARCGSVEVKFSSAVGNGASGYEAEAMGFMNADKSAAIGNRQQGYIGVTAGMVLVGTSQALGNLTGIESKNLSLVIADGAKSSYNTAYGINATSGSIVFGAGAIASLNDVTDTFLTEGGVINATGAAALGSLNLHYQSGSHLIGIDGETLHYPELILRDGSGKLFRAVTTSLGDVVWQFDTTGLGNYVSVITVKADGVFVPYVDGGPTLGRAANRWDTVYAVNGSINTSDANQKQDIAYLDRQELEVAQKLKGLIKKFRFVDAVQKKGDGARIHAGVIAQDVKAAFESSGLDPHRYGVFCEDILDDGSIRLGIRYDELFAFIISAI